MNALVADKLVTWLKENIGPYYATMVTSPSYLAVHIAPDEVKKELLTRIQHPEILGYLTIQEHDPVAWNQFLVWMKRQDLYRKQKFECKLEISFFTNLLQTSLISLYEGLGN
jgi:hypothetical protein